MAKILMQLDDTNSEIIALTTEAGNIIGAVLVNIRNTINSSGEGWWTGPGAEGFFNALNKSSEELESYSLQLMNFYDRINLELIEWTDVDLSYNYKNPAAMFQEGQIVEGWAGTEGGWNWAEIKIDVTRWLGDAIPWWLRYPADSYSTEQYEFFGLTWTKTQRYGVGSGGGLYGGATGGGSFFGGTEWEEDHSTTILGIPFIFSRHSYSFGGKLGVGGEVTAALGGLSISIAGIEIGIDAGVGFGIGEEGVRFGPLSVDVTPEFFELFQPGRPAY
jgi:hypothetical protein